MKILTIIDSYGAGGAQNQLSYLAAGLKQNGHEVHSFQYFPDNFFEHRLSDAGITQHFSLKKGKLGINVVRALTELYNVEKYDIALSYMDTPNFYAAAARRMAKHKPALVVSHRMSTNIAALNPVTKQLLFWTNREANAVVCNSYHERDNWLQAQPKLPAYTIYNGIKDSMNGQSLALQTCPSDFNDPQSGLPTLLAVGTVTKRKNAETIALAMSVLKKKGTLNFKLIWLGEPKHNLQEDTLYKTDINKLLDELNLKSYWVWAGQQNDTLGFYRYADALIHASLLEGLPNVICEAQLAGLPVFASDVLDHKKMLVDGTSGFCFDHTKTTELAEMLRTYFAKTPTEKLQYRKNARASALELFLLEKCVKQYEAVFKKLV